MRKGFVIFLSLFFILACFGLSFAADPDLKGSKDHPLVSRMPNFHITEYKDADFDAYPFFDQEKKGSGLKAIYILLDIHWTREQPNQEN